MVGPKLSRLIASLEQCMTWCSSCAVVTTFSLEDSYNLRSGLFLCPCFVTLWSSDVIHKRRLSLLVGDTDQIGSQDASAGCLQTSVVLVGEAVYKVCAGKEGI